MRYPQRDVQRQLNQTGDQVGVTQTAGLHSFGYILMLVKPGSVLISLIPLRSLGLKTRLHAPCLRIPSLISLNGNRPDLIVDFWRNGAGTTTFAPSSSMYLVS